MVFLVSAVGMFVYIFEMSREARRVFSFSGMFFRSLIRCVVFLMFRA
jgi:hypothetical protein